MKYRQLGKSELRVSEVGLGGNTFGPPRLDRDQSVACIRRAADVGINFIDTASIYGEGQSESYVGDAIAVSRSQWIIATKFNLWHLAAGETQASRIRTQCEQSLRRLKTDYIDLYQLHMPTPEMDIDAVLETLAQLLREGKVRYVGACNLASWRHAQALNTATARGWPALVSSQNHYNLLRRQVELETLPFCEANGIGFLPYHPLAGGFLTDKYVRGEPPPAGTRGAAGSPIVAKTRTARAEDVQDRLKQWARERGHRLGELAISWLLSRSAVVSVIAGVSSPEQVKFNAMASEWRLTENEIREVDSIAAWDGSDVGFESYLTPSAPRLVAT